MNRLTSRASLSPSLSSRRLRRSTRYEARRRGGRGPWTNRPRPPALARQQVRQSRRRAVPRRPLREARCRRLRPRPPDRVLPRREEQQRPRHRPMQHRQLRLQLVRRRPVRRVRVQLRHRLRQVGQLCRLRWAQLLRPQRRRRPPRTRQSRALLARPRRHPLRRALRLLSRPLRPRHRLAWLRARRLVPPSPRNY